MTPRPGRRDFRIQADRRPRRASRATADRGRTLRSPARIWAATSPRASRVSDLGSGRAADAGPVSRGREIDSEIAYLIQSSRPSCYGARTVSRSKFFSAFLALLLVLCLGGILRAAPSPQAVATQGLPQNGAGALPTLTLETGEEIFQAACIGCHGSGGEGQPITTLGFEPPATFPDFTDCNGSSRERRFDWRAVIHEGGYAGSWVLRHHAVVCGGADPRADRQGDRTPADALHGARMAARRDESAAPVVHREGVPGRRVGHLECRQRQRRGRRLKQDHLREAVRREESVRDCGALQLRAYPHGLGRRHRRPGDRFQARALHRCRPGVDLQLPGRVGDPDGQS